MKNMFASLILCATGCFLSTVVCNGQRNDKIVPTTPEAAALIKMTEYPVSMTSGVPDINIPLFEIKTGNLTLPVAISYHAGGFKINEQSTRVGLGWSLTCELQITRTINGTDDFFSKGYINNNLRNTIPYPFIKNTGYLRCPSENIYNIASGDVDGMPDKFSYQLLGKSGSFFFDQGSSGTFNFIPVPYDNIKITFTNDRFIITDTDGTTYYFEEKENTGDVISLGTCMNCHTTAWKCTKIVSNVGIQEITFTYSPKTVKKYQTKTDCNESYSAVYYHGSLDFGNYYRSDLSPFSQSSIYNPLQYPLFRVSNPKYIEFFANGQSPLLHVPYYNETQKVLVDKTYDGSQLNPANNPYNNQSSVQGFSISTIEFRGGKVTFNNADKLTQISITDKKNSSVKSIQLFHSYQAPVYLESAKSYNGQDFLGTMYLDSIRLSNNGTAFERYVFLYNSKDCFGNHLTGHDAWGYPNAYTHEINNGGMYSMPAITNDETFYLNLGGSVNSAKNVSYQMQGSDWALAPGQEYMRRGVLKRVIYPNGGFTDFDFEANKHTSFAYNVAYGKYGNMTCRPHQLAGGLRIRSINYYNVGQEYPASQKYYVYGENENGAGNLLFAPKINSSGQVFNIGAVDVVKYLVHMKGNCLSSNCTRNQFTPLSIEKKTTYYPASVLDYTYNGVPVYYTTVTEYNSDYGSLSGKKVYQFYSPKDFITPWYPWYSDPRVGKTLISYIRTSGYSGIPKSYSEYRFTVASKYELSRKKTYTYDTYKQKDIQVAYADFNIIYDVVSGSGLSNAFDYYNDLHASPASSRLNESDFIYGCYNIPAAKPLLRSETDETYEGLQTISQTTSYTYTRLQPSRIETTNSKGERMSKYLKYSYDFNGIYSTMAGKNMISQEIEERLRNETTGKDIRTLKNNYDIKTDAGGILPVSTVITYVNGSTVTEATFDKYDQYGNVLQMTGKDNIPVSYLWGYQGLYPVARIEGATYAQIPARFISNINIVDPSDDASLRNQLSELRNSLSSIGTAFTGYTYKYLTGVTSISKPNGTLEYYNYDAYGRLVSVVDHNNQTISQYTYNLVAPQPAAFNTWCVNTPVMKSLYNCPCGGYNRSYNSVYYGGSQRATSVEMANESAEISVAYVQGIRLMPDCTNPVQTVPVKLQAYYNKQYSSTVPGKIYIDFIQNGSVVFTECFTMDEVDGPLNPKLLYIPVGDYILSFRTTAENNYSFKGVLMYELFNSNNTSGSDSPLIANQEVVMFQPGNQYEIRVSPCKIIP